MPVTVAELEKRLAHVEQEVADLRQIVDRAPQREHSSGRGAQMLAEARRSQPAISEAIAKAFEEMGIEGEPVGAEKLREMMAVCGVRAEENAFSREIEAMREE